MATFVLVHGAMHGGWCWRAVRERLAARGHEVHAPTLTGQGDRRQALTPETGIATHVTDLDGDGWRVPASPAFLEQWGITDPGLCSFVGPRLTDFPLRCTTDPVDFDPGPLSQLGQAYVNHTGPPLASLGPSFDRAVAAGFPTRELPCGHDLMLAAPAETAALLEAITIKAR